MTHVITRLCQDCVDGACVDVCPVDAIVAQRAPGVPSELPRQLFISPTACIDCFRCVGECPWEAIFQDDDVPAPFASDVALNAHVDAAPEAFHVPVARLRRGASPAEVRANQRRHGLP